MEELLQRLREFSRARDWGKFHTPKSLAMSVSIEAGELLEAFQWRRDEEHMDAAERGRVIDEAADVLIYTLLLLDKFEVDPLDVCHEKIARNELRFPKDKTYGVARSQRKTR